MGYLRKLEEEKDELALLYFKLYFLLVHEVVSKEIQ